MILVGVAPHKAYWNMNKCKAVEWKIGFKAGLSYLMVTFQYIGWSTKVAQLLVRHNFKTAHNISTKLHTAFFQHVFNHFVNFQSKWTTNVETTVALKFGV